MERLVLTSLAKNPIDRFQTAEEFLRHLSAAAVGRIPDGARPCVTETGPPSVVPKPAESLPLQPGDQEDIETLDSMPATAPFEDGGPVVPTPSPSPAAPWSTPDDREVRPRKTASHGRKIIVIGAVAIVLVITLASLVLFLLSDGDGPDDAMPNTPGGDSLGGRGSRDSLLHEPGETTTIWIDVLPLDATITWDGRVMNDRPFVVPRDSREIEMLISYPGFIPERLMIRPDQERSVRVNLRRVP
jgi:diadenosine tetraphosphatase ApaH/serine/threonine PP2A family protein phosphatase